MVPVAPSVGSWAEERRVLGSRPRADTAWKVFWQEGKLQSRYPLGVEPVTPPCDPERVEVVTRQV